MPPHPAEFSPHWFSSSKLLPRLIGLPAQLVPLIKTMTMPNKKLKVAMRITCEIDSDLRGLARKGLIDRQDAQRVEFLGA